MNSSKYIIALSAVLSISAYANNNDVEQYHAIKSLDGELTEVSEQVQLEFDVKTAKVEETKEKLQLFADNIFFDTEEEKFLTVLMKNMPQCKPGFDPKLTYMRWSCEPDYGEPLAIISHKYKQPKPISNSNPTYINGWANTFNILNGYDETNIIAALYSYNFRSVDVEEGQIKVVPYRGDAYFTIKVFHMP